MQFYTTSRRTWLTGRIACALALATVLSPRSVAQQSRGPFSEAEVVQALKGDVPPKQVAELARQYGISFQLTAESQARLRKAGATNGLLEALRSLAPPPPLPPPKVAGPLLIRTIPPAAQVFLDGRPIGMTDAKGELQLAQLLPGEHKVRLTLAGYEDYEQTTNLLAGQSASIPVTLKKSEVNLPPTPLLPVKTFRVTHKGRSGELVIGNGKLSYRAESDSDSFESPLNEITYGPNYQRRPFATRAALDGFYLRPRDGRDRDFKSESTPAILELLQQLGR